MELLLDSKLHSLHEAYAEICAGAEPWVALGNFMNDFFGYHIEYRQELLNEAVVLPTEPSETELKWAIFCAASAEYLSQEYQLPTPMWVSDPAYEKLAEPWYHALAAHRPKVRELLERTTPNAFAKRNIFCGNRVFVNKYERRSA